MTDSTIANGRGLFLSRLNGRLGQHRAALLYTAASVFNGACGVAANFIILRLVPPADMGIWQAALLVQVYGAFVQLGVTNGLGRDLPLALGRGDQAQAQQLAATTMAWARICAIAVAAIGLLLAILYPFQSLSWRVAFLANFLVVALQPYNGFLLGLYRSANSFQKLALATLFNSIIQSGTLVFVVWWGLWGLGVRAILVAGLVLIPMHLWRPIRAQPRLHRTHFISLLRTGLPLLLLSYAATQVLALDRSFLALAAPTETLGRYALITYIYTGMLLVPTSLGHYVYPQMSYRLGKSGRPPALWEIAWKSFVAILLLTLPVVLVGFWALWKVVPWLAPEYTAAVQPAAVALVGAWLYGGVIAANALNSVKAWRSLIALIVVATLGFVVAWMAAAGLPLLWRATLAGFVARLVYSFGGLLLTWLRLRSRIEIRA